MTDKQIIIDNIDVSECSDISGHVNDFGEYECLCCCIFGGGSDDYGIIGHEMCKDNPNCYYKQLKRKEQECEELKKEQTEIKKYLGISHKTILERLEELTDFRDRDREELDQLKQTITEIKEIAETCSFTDSSELLLSRIKQVLQKINEVANDNR